MSDSDVLEVIKSNLPLSEREKLKQLMHTRHPTRWCTSNKTRSRADCAEEQWRESDGCYECRETLSELIARVSKLMNDTTCELHCKLENGESFVNVLTKLDSLQSKLKHEAKKYRGTHDDVADKLQELKDVICVRVSLSINQYENFKVEGMNHFWCDIDAAKQRLSLINTIYGSMDAEMREDDVKKWVITENDYDWLLQTEGFFGWMKVMAFMIAPMDEYAKFSSYYGHVEHIRYILIPRDVTTIGYSAFYNFTDLIAVYAESVTNIEDDAFYGCGKLTSIPDSVEIIGNYAFDGCRSLTTLPHGVKVIGTGSFNETNLTTIPSSVTTIGEDAFQGCHSLTTIPDMDGDTEVGPRAFKNCPNLRSVGNGIKTIRDNAFRYDTRLTTVGNGVKVIGNGAFVGCHKLKTIENGVEIIGDRAFEDCKSLTTLIDSASKVGIDAFKGCTRLKPRRPRNAYMLFVFDNRSAIKDQNPNATGGEVSKLLHIQWKAMSEEHKQPYEAAYKANKDKFDKDMKTYLRLTKY